MEVILCPITGFCSGVRAALNRTTDMLKQHGPPVFILHDLVHNESVVNDLLSHGAKIVDEPEGLPPGATLIFSAHGVSEAVEARARALPLNIVDATCPLVRKVQERGAELSEEGRVVLLFGKAGHREVEGILGRIHGEKHLLTNEEDARDFQPDSGRTYACISQTTMNSDVIAEMTAILRGKIPGLVESASVCRATLMRQNAVRELAAKGVQVVPGLVDAALSVAEPGMLHQIGDQPAAQYIQYAPAAGAVQAALGLAEAVQGTDARGARLAHLLSHGPGHHTPSRPHCRHARRGRIAAPMRVL